jgi:hypothetical protein
MKAYVEPSPLTERIAAIAVTKPLAERARMQQMLVTLDVLGTEGPLLQTLFECLQSADLFPDGFYIPTVSVGRDRPHYELKYPEPNRCVDQLLSARNLKLRDELIIYGFLKPSVDQQRRLVVLLDQVNLRARFCLVNAFASWQKRPDREVKHVQDKATGDVTYPNLDEMVEWWKQYWREH